MGAMTPHGFQVGGASSRTLPSPGLLISLILHEMCPMSSGSQDDTSTQQPLTPKGIDLPKIRMLGAPSTTRGGLRPHVPSPRGSSDGVIPSFGMKSNVIPFCPLQDNISNINKSSRKWVSCRRRWGHKQRPKNSGGSVWRNDSSGKVTTLWPRERADDECWASASRLQHYSGKNRNPD